MKYIDDITNFIFLNDAPTQADIIFVPGGSYPEIAETAAKLWIENYAPLILPSGKFCTKLGYFPGVKSKSDIYDKNYSTEWEFLKDVLVRNCVSEESILREDNATFTYENAILSRKVTDSLMLNIKKAIICCKSFHARRCLMYYETLFPETEFLICSTDVKGITKDNWFKTNEGIDIILGEIERCGWQFKNILKNVLI